MASNSLALLRSNRGHVEKAIQSELKWIAQKLSDPEVEVLTESEYNQVTNAVSLFTEEDKAGMVVKRVVQRVELDPAFFDVFLGILEEKRVKFKSLLDKLRGGSQQTIHSGHFMGQQQAASGQPMGYLGQPMGYSGQPMGHPGQPLDQQQQAGQPRYMMMGQPAPLQPQSSYPTGGQSMSQYPQPGYPMLHGGFSTPGYLCQPQPVHSQAGYQNQPYWSRGPPPGAEQFVPQSHGNAGYVQSDMMNSNAQAPPPSQLMTSPVGGEAISSSKHILNLDTVDESALDRDDDMAALVEAVHRLAGNWRKFCMHLHLRDHTLDTIRADNSNAEHCLHRGISEWLKLNYNFEKFGRPSWRMLVDAVSKLDSALACEIAGQHRSKASNGHSGDTVVARGGSHQAQREPHQVQGGLHRAQEKQYPALRFPISLPRLNIIKWRAMDGMEHKLRPLEKMSVKWKAFGGTVGISGARLEGIDRECMSRNSDCIHKVVIQWMQMDSSEYPATWEGLVKLLDDIDMHLLMHDILEVAATDVKSLHST